MPLNFNAIAMGGRDVGYPISLDQRYLNTVGWFAVDEYGAVGNGVVNDTVAIQAAITAAEVAGGIVYFPPKPYKITSLTISSHCVTLLGAGRGLAPGEYGGSFTKGTQLIGTNGFVPITVGNCGYAHIRDMDIHLPSGATSACVAIDLNQAYNARVENVRIANFSTGIKLRETTDTYINNNYIGSEGVTVSPTIGIDIDGTTAQNASVFIDNNIVALASFSGLAYGYYLHGDRINDVSIQGCEADFVSIGYLIDGTGVDTGYGADIRLTSCIADGVSVGFKVNACTVDSGVTIANGWASASTDAILISGASNNVSVSGMQTIGAANGISISAGGFGNKITNNTFLYCSQNGVLLTGSPFGTVISHNTFIAKPGAVMAGACINVITAGTVNFSMVGNIAQGTAANQFANGIVVPAACDPFTAVGNVMPAAYVTTPYTLNLGSNVNSKDVGNI